MEYVDQYCSEVARFLPAAVRSDVQLELRSLLAESLEQRCRDDDSVGPINHATDLLAELGPPHVLAASYLPDPPAPRVPQFHVFKWLAIAVVVSLIVPLLVVVEFAFDGRQQSWLGPVHWNWASVLPLVSCGLSVVGTVLVAFAAARRIATSGPSAGEWYPKDAPERVRSLRVDYERVTASRAILAAVMLSVVLLPGAARESLLSNGPNAESMFRLGPNVIRAVPWIVLCFSLELIVGALLLGRARWTLALSGLAVLGGIGWIAILASILIADPIVVANGAALKQTFGVRSVTSAASIVGELANLARVALALTLVLAGRATFHRTSRLIQLGKRVTSPSWAGSVATVAHDARTFGRMSLPVRRVP